MRKRRYGYRRTFIKIMMIVLFFSSFLFLLLQQMDFCYLQKRFHFFSSVVDEPNKASKKIENSLSFVMVGDALIHGAVYDDAKQEDGGYDFRPMVEFIKPMVSSYDLRYYNQETVLGGFELGLSTYPRFNSPYEVGDAFLDMGFNLVSLANNHTMDRGETAVCHSLQYWKDKPVYTAGSYSSFEDREKTAVHEKNGIRFAFFSYTTWNNGLSTPIGKEYLNNEYSKEQVQRDIQRVRDDVDIIIVAMHWGTEYSFDVSLEQREIAEYLAQLEVDIIVGSHPHVVQPIEFIGKTMVVYSLGNFLSAQRGVERLTGLMASVTIKKTIDHGLTSIELLHPKAELLYTYYDSKITGFKVIPYRMLNDQLLPNYRGYYDRFMNIVVPEGSVVEKVVLDESR